MIMSHTLSHNDPMPPQVESPAVPDKGLGAGQGSRLGGYALVAIVSLAIGAAGAVIALRYAAGGSPEIATGPAATTGGPVPSAAGDAMAGWT
jgi:hypothetical protein